jgi:hypothetical protein
MIDYSCISFNINQFTGYTESLDKKSHIVVPDDDHGLYAIDILDPSWVSKLTDNKPKNTMIYICYFLIVLQVQFINHPVTTINYDFECVLLNPNCG